MRKWQSASIAVTAAAVMLLTACGQEPGGAGANAAQPAGQAEAAVPQDPGGGYGESGSTGASRKAKPAGQLTIGDSEELGPVLTDSAGFTLYRFDKDTANPPKSACEGACVKAWPPVPAADVSSTSGIDAALLGEVTRSDGTKQLTVDGWPMYRYAKDTEPWQTNGQGVGGTWHAAAPDGKKAQPGSETGGEPAGSAPAGGSEAGAELPAISAVKDAELGEILRDAEGRTLYRFTKDSAWPMKSNCVGKCEKLWKPARPVDLKDVEDIDPKLLTTYKRPDGSKQLTVDCWPLYWYTGDEKPGDTNGQGVGGTWFAVAPSGKLIKS
ncbi:SCO0930 family lipoprotein [Streptomyces xinghaiensis]|uniref:SCO0930 family lipoprotein n=1 Tax=Streptomyces xinghaiensis TaxID=1038928 RepID=UPI00341589FC